uniref:Transcription initiation factor TFIID subunit 1 n=1 Tax=Caenorhabditis tropicalis TaxID=1561998 RepID=A0A1I7UG77_9PELO
MFLQIKRGPSERKKANFDVTHFLPIMQEFKKMHYRPPKKEPKKSSKKYVPGNRIGNVVPDEEQTPCTSSDRPPININFESYQFGLHEDDDYKEHDKQMKNIKLENICSTDSKRFNLKRVKKEVDEEVETEEEEPGMSSPKPLSSELNRKIVKLEQIEAREDIVCDSRDVQE